MSNASMLSALRAATPSDPLPGAPARVTADPFPGVARSGVGLVTSAYPGDSLLMTTPRRVGGAAAPEVAPDASRHAVAGHRGGIEVHHATVTFDKDGGSVEYGPESVAVLKGLEPVQERPRGYVIGTHADRRSAFATDASSVCGIFEDARDDRDDGMMRISGGMHP